MRVIQEEFDLIVAGLRERGADGKYLLREEQAHGLVNRENNIEMFQTVEAFLDRTIGAGRP